MYSGYFFFFTILCLQVYVQWQFFMLLCLQVYVQWHADLHG